MRLHALEAAAFGPFTEPVSVDFDDLSAQGLFLLSGPTGAGKTSVLDAVCFALYGEVPGERAGAKRLRSDQAPPDAEPRVRLLVTLAGRRLEITRTPAWQRPKRRGAGLTSQQATVRIREDVGGDWTTLTTRHDEAGLLVGDLLGMNQAQFTQVAMLPQGRFQTFLRAGADERQKLLQQLFGTARFERVEAWLKERRTGLRREVDAAHRTVADAVSRTSEAAATALPGWDCDDLAEPALGGDLETWAGGLAGGLLAAHRGEQRAADDVERAESDARRRAEQARARVERHRRLERARAELAVLDARAAEHARESAALEAAGRARAVRGVHALAEAAGQALDQAAHHEDGAVARAREVLGLGEATALDERGWRDLAAAEDRAAVEAESLVPVARRLARVQSDLVTHRERLPALREHRDGLARRLDGVPSLLTTLRARLDEARGAASAATSLRVEVASLEARQAARARAGSLAVALDGAREAHRLARERTLDCRGRVLDLREARLAGMAGEIAHSLAAGDSCPVCGSAEHPAKAAASTAGPDRDAETAAQREADDASATEHLRDTEVRTLEAESAAALAQAGEEDDAALRARHDEAADALARTEALAALVEPRADEVARVEQAQRADTAACTAAEAELARLEATAAAWDEEATVLLERLSTAAPAAATSGEATGRDLAETLEERRARCATRGASAARAAHAVAARAGAADHRARTDSELSVAVERAGFTDLAAALAAVLDDDAQSALAGRVHDHDQRLAAVRAVLADLAAHTDPAVDDEAPLPDPVALEAEHRAALVALREHHARLEDLRRRSARLADLAEQVRGAVATWAPRHRELALVAGLSAVVEGRGCDNRLQMRLSAYVLAFRLSQVVAAANVRLGRMSDQRYSLEHTAERGRDRRGGLGLEVRDDWSGQTRSPATLSGGETFVVSLALALGLSDVVTAEAGGAELDTLFVDEGFGSLDPETLDDVMDTLDALRDGGRVVGVVSHVTEMRERIPTQLVVTKARTGSTLSVRR